MDFDMGIYLEFLLVVGEIIENWGRNAKHLG